MEHLRRDGLALAYEEAGSGAPPIVLVHDLGSDHTCFIPQFKHFSRDHRVVAVDLRGHGQSEGSREAPAGGLLADDLAWMCYELGLYRPVVLGHGLGGLVALDLASRYQDLPSAIVAVASVVDSPARPVTVASLTLPPQVFASIPENAAIEDYVTATARCGAPLLHVAFHAGEAVLSEKINSLVNEFLSGLAGRAPP